VVGLLLAALSGANAYVLLKAESDPARAQKVWAGHPAVLRSVAFQDIGLAAAARREPGSDTLVKVERLAANAPLEPDAFLINGALAQRAGDSKRAEQLFLEARQRDPRSAAARYLLADYYLRSGATLKGLQELAILGRLVNGATAQLVPGLAAYARQPGAAVELKRILAANPELEGPVLASLSEDATNADLVLSLASKSAPGAPPPAWQRALLQSLVQSGQFAKAHSIWSRLAGLPAVPTGIFKPAFAPSPAPPPFNWSFAEAGGGVAEPISGGGLHVLYFGREDVALASQTLTLASGRYLFSTQIGGDLANAQQLRWVLRCLPGSGSAFDLPLSKRDGRMFRAQFTVPASGWASGCGAQRLELRGVGEEMAKSSDVTIGALQLTRIAGQ